MDRAQLLPQRVEHLARTRPDAVAIQDAAGSARTWSQLHDGALHWAALLRDAGVQPGDPVASLLPTGFDSYESWIALAWLGAVEVPINTMYRGTMLSYVLRSSEAQVLLSSGNGIELVASVQSELTHLKTVVVADGVAVHSVHGALAAEVVDGTDRFALAVPTDLTGPDPWDVMAMVFTSGTTGASKGVLVPWGELFHWLSFVPADFVDSGTTYYSTFPTFHLSGKAALYTAAHADATLLFRETFSLSEFWSDVRRFDVRSAGLVGPMAAMLLANPEQDDDADNPLRSIMLGPVIPGIEAFRERFGVERYASGYGTTEIGFPLVTPWNPPNPDTCGKVRVGSPGYEVRIVDEHDQPVEPGTVGELIIRATEPWSMNLGYHRMAEVTAASWRNGWFHTGDAFRVDADGWFYLADRIKDTLRRRGENISSAEVEAEVLAHPEVIECAVIAVPSELGEDDVKAVIVLKPGSALTPEDLIAFLSPRLARFMLPRYIEVTPTLPRTEGTFRVRKVELRANPVNAHTWDRDSV